MDLGLSGLASGFDWRALVEQLSDVERAPQRQLRTEQSAMVSVNTALGNLKTQLQALQSKLESLQDDQLFGLRSARVSDGSLATATANPGAPEGEYRFAVTQFATAAAYQGRNDTGASLSPTDDVADLTLAEAGFARSITAGTFTVNGKAITIATSDTLQGVFDQISAATGGVVSASFDAATDTIALASSSQIVLGTSTDTSNFLQAAKLYNNGTGTIQSSGPLGAIRLSSSLASARFAVPATDGGSGNGRFKINGVTISFNAATDSVATVLERINASAAGVAASYDAEHDRFLLVNKTTGDVGIALEDVTGNFLAATQLATGTFQRGNDLHYTVNGGAELVSRSNAITGENSGLTGLSVNLTITAVPSNFTVRVASDTDKIKTAINDFIAEYNKTQAMIDTQTASSTDANGKVTAGILAGRGDVYEIASRLRGMATQTVSGLGGSLNRLHQLGIDSNGNDNSIVLVDSAKLDAALNDQLSSVAALFADGTGGLATHLVDFIEMTVGDDGTLASSRNNLSKQSAAIDTQVAEMERLVLANQQRLIDSFVAMETAQASINQQLQYLQRTFPAS